MKKRLAILFIGLALVVSLAGCKKEESGENSAVPTNELVSEEGEEYFDGEEIYDETDEDIDDEDEDFDEEVEDEEESEEDIQFEEDPYEGKEWEIGLGYNNPPFAVSAESDSDSGWGFATFGGIDSQIISAVALDQNLTYITNLLTYDEMIEACKSGEIQGFLCGVEITDEHKNEGMIFSDSYYESDGKEYGFVIMDSANQYLIDKFNDGLANIKTSGEYDTIIAEY